MCNPNSCKRCIRSSGQERPGAGWTIACQVQELHQLQGRNCSGNLPEPQGSHKVGQPTQIPCVSCRCHIQCDCFSRHCLLLLLGCPRQLHVLLQIGPSEHILPCASAAAGWLYMMTVSFNADVGLCTVLCASVSWLSCLTSNQASGTACTMMQAGESDAPLCF